MPHPATTTETAETLATLPAIGAPQHRDPLRSAILVRGDAFHPVISNNALAFVRPAPAFWDDLWVTELAGADVVVRAAGTPRGGILIQQREGGAWKAITRDQWWASNPRQILGILNPRDADFATFVRDRFAGTDGRTA